jgi:hypothetical protein
MAECRYWFRLPDEETMLMSLRPAELRCYLVVMRDIQRSKNSGLISARQVSDRTGISLQHTHAALESLVATGRLECNKKPGSITRYSMPFTWETQNNRSPVGEHRGSAHRSPVGEQSQDSNPSPRAEPAPRIDGSEDAGEQSGEHHRSPTGEQHCSPTGEQHLESSESSELQRSFDDSPASRKPRAKAAEFSGDGGVQIPKPETQKHTPEDRKLLTIVLAKHLGHVVGPMAKLETPADGDLDSVLAALGDLPVTGFCRYLENMPARYKPGGRGAPRTWGWFISTARNYAAVQGPQAATGDKCEHGKPYNVCCNPPAVNDAMGDAFSTLDGFRRSA